jgi:hypothetical protein
VGYNSHPKIVSLKEPEKKKTWQLTHGLENHSIRILKKEMRDKRVRKKAYRDFVSAYCSPAKRARLDT